MYVVVQHQIKKTRWRPAEPSRSCPRASARPRASPRRTRIAALVDSVSSTFETIRLVVILAGLSEPARARHICVICM